MTFDTSAAESVVARRDGGHSCAFSVFRIIIRGKLELSDPHLPVPAASLLAPPHLFHCCKCTMSVPTHPLSAACDDLVGAAQTPASTRLTGSMTNYARMRRADRTHFRHIRPSLLSARSWLTVPCQPRSCSIPISLVVHHSGAFRRRLIFSPPCFPPPHLPVSARLPTPAFPRFEQGNPHLESVNC